MSPVLNARSICIFLPFFLASCSPFWANPETHDTPISTGSNITGSGENFSFRETQPKEEKVAEAKRRLTLRSFIHKGDYFFKKNDLDRARINYEFALAKVGGSDRLIEQRLADVLYETKDFPWAYEHYKKLPLKEIDTETRERFFQSFMFFEDLKDRQKELDAMPIDPSEKEYYSYVGSCYTGIHNCITRIEGFHGTGAKMLELLSSVRDYESVSQDFQYRNALLVGTFYKQKQYLAAAKIAEEILEKRPDYRNVVKMAGFSRLELGDYAKANEHLQRFFAFDPKDVDVAYSLGVVNYELGDYATSNLYYNNAVINGYRPKTELERRLIYNYYLLGDKKGTFKIFRYLLDETDVTKEDFEIAVFTAIEEREYGKGYLWAEKGMEKFPEDTRLLAMRGWISRIRGDEKLAIRDFTAALDTNRRESIALLQLGLLYLEKNEYALSKSYLEAAKDADTSGTFGDDAERALEELAKKVSLGSSTLSWAESTR